MNFVPLSPRARLSVYWEMYTVAFKLAKMKPKDLCMYNDSLRKRFPVRDLYANRFLPYGMCNILHVMNETNGTDITLFNLPELTDIHSDLDLPCGYWWDIGHWKPRRNALLLAIERLTESLITNRTHDGELLEHYT